MKVEFTATDCGRCVSGFKEKADCSVRAVSAALGLTYAEAHAKLETLGRKNRAGIKWKVLAIALPALGFEMRPDLSCITLSTALASMQVGRFVVKHARHVFAVVNGVVIDMTCPAAAIRVKMVYQVK